MWLKEITVSNYKAIREMSIGFQQGVNLLIGDNGVGKTSVLEAITVAFGDFINGMSGVAKKGISSNDVRMDTKMISDASQGIIHYTPITITSIFYTEDGEKNGEVTRRDETAKSKTRFLGKQISDYANKKVNDLSEELPLFCYYSTSRLAPPKREDYGTVSKNKLNDRRCGYIGCMENNLDIKALKTWCFKMEMAAFQQNKQIAEYQAFKEIVADFMYQMNELEEKPQVTYSRAFEDIVYTENGETIPVNYLSAGYQSLLWMVMDMAFRMAVLNPGKASLNQCEGIVLIDEVDMHLHPKWQWKIVDALQKSFPKIQFILATHSPIIISSCKNATLLEIDGKQEVSNLSDAYAYSVSDVLSYRQGSSEIPDKLKQLSKRFEININSKEYETAKGTLKQMMDIYGEDNSLVKKGKFKLRMAGINLDDLH
ncbi:MAG: AAA family ATPase [Lachnospiraceae bacterium]|nr:AAA family ATPase [Lachnospiraceae bacterium]